MSLSNIKVNNNQVIGIDDEPKSNSKNLVQSEGVYENMMSYLYKYVCGLNLVSFAKYRWGYINTAGQVIYFSEFSNWQFIESFIPVNKNNIWRSIGHDNAIPGFLIYDSNYRFKRYLPGATRIYSYEEGDAYVRLNIQLNSYDYSNLNVNYLPSGINDGNYMNTLPKGDGILSNYLDSLNCYAGLLSFLNVNLLNVFSYSVNYYFDQAGTIKSVSPSDNINSYYVTSFIPTLKSNLILNYNFGIYVFVVYKVYDQFFNFIRQGAVGDFHYVYQTGEYFVKFSSNRPDLNSLYYEVGDRMKYPNPKINIPVKNFLDYNPFIFKTALLYNISSYNDIDFKFEYSNYPIWNSMEFKIPSTQLISGGVFTNYFTCSSMCYVNFEYTVTGASENKISCWLYGQKPEGGDEYALSANGPFNFDASSLYVYHGYTKFRILFGISSDHFSGNDINVKIENLIINDIPNSNLMDLADLVYDVKKENVNQNISIDTVRNDINQLKDKTNYIIAPNTEKYIISVDNSGNLFTIPLIPDNVLILGNSLVYGHSDYGMCASSAENDYYYWIGHELTRLLQPYNKTLTINKVYTSPFEHSVNEQDFQDYLSTLIPMLNSNLKWVSIQAGDNVNTQEKIDFFRTSVDRFLKTIRQYAPNARVSWTYAWYTHPENRDIIINACNNNNIEFINISDIHTSATESYVGSTYYFPELKTYYFGYDSYTVNSSTNLTILFTSDNVQYSTTLDVESYTDDVSNHKLHITSHYMITSFAGAANHPNDIGFKRIAARMLYTLGIIDEDIIN